METSIFIGQILWPLMISIWIWLFFNTEMFQKIIHDILREPLALFISGLMWFVLWSMMLKYHNSWEISRNLLITILWWAIFIKSFLVIAFPKIIFSMIKNYKISLFMLQTFWLIYAFIWIIITYKSFT